ncbi:hypothetical protein BgiBS90_037098, partial [Biomphalaria glabrata]
IEIKVSGRDEKSISGEDFSLIVSKFCFGLGRGDRSHVFSTSALTWDEHLLLQVASLQPPLQPKQTSLMLLS